MMSRPSDINFYDSNEPLSSKIDDVIVSISIHINMNLS